MSAFRKLPPMGPATMPSNSEVGEAAKNRKLAPSEYFAPEHFHGTNPLEWLALLGLRVVGLRVGRRQHEFALILDAEDTQARADALMAEGDPSGEPLLVHVLEGRTAYVLQGYGDCCSETWLADVVGLHALLGYTVVDTRALELHDEYDKHGKPRTRQEYDSVYGWEITAARGHCTLAVRNSSNGYYGGELRFKGFEPLSSVADWHHITEDDWSA